MNRKSGFVIIVLVVLFTSVLIAGCTNSAPANNSTVQTTAIATAPSTAALYRAGDIVRSPKTAEETGYLILKYDAGADSYERAFIYRNDDGSWGYRVDSESLTLPRPAFEKINTVKVAHVDPSGVSLKKPAVTTQPVTAVTSPGSAAATTPPGTTKTPGMKPQIKGITPESGIAGTSVSISDLKGDGFQNGASVILARSGSQNISATSVNTLSAKQLSCTFLLPANATIGIWDLLVINPDGQSAGYTNGFTVRANTNPTTATTTSPTAGISITSIDPTNAYSGNYYSFTLQGSNFKDGITCKLTKSGKPNIPASTVQRTSDTQMQCFFAIPSGSMGAWNVVLENTDGTTGTLTDGLTVG